MADIFGSVPAPRIGFIPSQTESGEFGRNFLSGMVVGQRARALALEEEQFRKRYDEGTLQNKQLAATIVTEQLKNNLAKRNIDWGVEAAAYFADPTFQALSPEEVLKRKPTGNPLIDVPLERTQNDALSKVQARASFISKQQATTQGAKLVEANPRAFIKFMKSFDKEGNPTDESMDILADNASEIQAYEKAKEMNKATFLGAQLRADTATAAAQKRAEEAGFDPENIQVDERGNPLRWRFTGGPWYAFGTGATLDYSSTPKKIKVHYPSQNIFSALFPNGVLEPPATVTNKPAAGANTLSPWELFQQQQNER